MQPIDCHLTSKFCSNSCTIESQARLSARLTISFAPESGECFHCIMHGKELIWAVINGPMRLIGSSSVCKEIFKAIFCHINSSARMHGSNIINLLVSFPLSVGIWNEFASLELSSTLYGPNLHGIRIHVRIFKLNVLTADII